METKTIQLRIDKKTEATGKDNSIYWVIETGQGKFGVWKPEINNALVVGKIYDIEYSEKGKYKNIAKVLKEVAALQAQNSNGHYQAATPVPQVQYVDRNSEIRKQCCLKSACIFLAARPEAKTEHVIAMAHRLYAEINKDWEVSNGNSRQ